MRYWHSSIAFVAMLSACSCSTMPHATVDARMGEPPIPVTDIFAGRPPTNFMGSRQMEVSVGTLAECGEPPKDHYFVGCVRNGVIHMGNPCDYPGDYAAYLCHELAHKNGWPRSHGPQ